MQIFINDNCKTVNVFLSRDDSSNPETEIALSSLYAKHVKSKYRVVVFRSGEGKISEGIEHLLTNNMKMVVPSTTV